MNRPGMWLIIAFLAIAGGCCSKQQAQQSNRICVQGVDRQAVMDTSQEVLENMHFVIEKADTNAGYISTRPLPAKQFFEVWRSDVVGCQNFAEDNIHSVTRIAEITIIQQQDDFCLECRVDARRLSVPQLDIASWTDLPGVFSQGSAGVQSLKFRKAQKERSAWIDLGPDTELEAKILQKISKRLSATGI